jgi:PAS domain S-box-containing protein
VAGDPYRYYRVEAREILDALGQGALELERGSVAPERVSDLLRLAHTLKVTSRVVNQAEIAALAHEVEEKLAPHRDAGAVPLARAREILRLARDMEALLAALAPPQARTAGDQGQPVKEPIVAIRVDVEDADAVLRVLSEQGAHVAVLRREVSSLDAVRRLAASLADEISPRRGVASDGRPGRARTAAEDLRGELARLQRGLSAAVDQAERDHSEARAGAERLRLVPTGTLFTPLERAARDAAVALQTADCVLLDTCLAGLSGYDTARRIRASSERRNLPIIMMLSALDESRALIEALNSGADDFVNKSSGFEVVGARVRAHLRRRQVEEENRLGREQSLRQEAAGRLLTAAEEEKERLSSLISSIADEIWFADTQRRFTLLNPAALGEFQLGNEAVEIEKLAASLGVFRPDGSPRPIEEAPPLRALGGEVVRNSEEIIRTPAHGELRFRQVSSSPVKDVDGHIVGSISVVRDVTEKKRDEERIRRRNAVLAGIAQIFRNTLSAKTEEELGSACLAVAEGVTQSNGAFLGEINCQTGRMDDVSISDLGWEACRMSDRSGHDRRLRVGLEVHGLYGRVLEDGKGFFTNDPSSHPDRIGTPPGHLPLKSFLGVPLLRDGETVGMVGLCNREGGYGPEELEIAEAIAPAIVQAFLSKRAQEALREREERLAVTLRSIGDAVIATDVAGRVTVFNRVAEELTGWKSEEALDRDLHEVFQIINEDTRQPTENPVRRVLDEGAVVGLGNHTALLARDGTERPIADSAAPIRDASGGITGVVLVFRDQTRERRAEQALRQADRRKDEFLGMLSHELRNPLAPISNSLYVLEHAPPGSERALEAQRIIRRQTEHLTRLVDDLLDVTRIARGKIEIHQARVDVREVVRGACHDHEVLFQDRGLALRVEISESEWIDADETRITQVIGNLLQNAARFSRPAGTVTVSVDTADGQHGSACVTTGSASPPNS